MRLMSSPCSVHDGASGASGRSSAALQSAAQAGCNMRKHVDRSNALAGHFKLGAAGTGVKWGKPVQSCDINAAAAASFRFRPSHAHPTNSASTRPTSRSTKQKAPQILARREEPLRNVRG